MIRNYEYYEDLWNTISIIPNKIKEIEDNVDLLLKGKDKYLTVSSKINVPWFLVGLIHGLEASYNWSCNLHNGEYWNKKTTLVPIGRGPFASWEDSVIDAFLMKKTNFHNVWRIGEIGLFLELYNGMGYFGKDKNSPYLWSFCNHGLNCGKYTSDGKYDPNASSKQPGGLVILKRLLLRCPEIDVLNPFICFSPKIISEKAKKYQEYMQTICLKDKITIDGKLGMNSSAIHNKIFGRYLFGDPRNM